MDDVVKTEQDELKEDSPEYPCSPTLNVQYSCPKQIFVENVKLKRSYIKERK